MKKPSKLVSIKVKLKDRDLFVIASPAFFKEQDPNSEELVKGSKKRK